MLDKDLFLQIVKDTELDEVWVNFSNPFGEVHDKDGERLYLVKWVDNIQDEGLKQSVYKLLPFFAPKYNSDDEDDILAVGLFEYLVTNNSACRELFEDNKGSLTCIYKKGVGILGT